MNGVRLVRAGAVLGMVGVTVGAFGAHGLRGRLSPDLLDVWETGARYQMYHALATLAAAWAESRWPGGTARWAGWLFVSGTCIFSGSLYALALTGQAWLGAVTPLGGLLLIAGWGVFIFAPRGAPRGT